MLVRKPQNNIKLNFKQLIVRALLSILRGMICLKRHFGPAARAFSSPFSAVGRFLIRVLGIPAYRTVFFIKRHTSRFVMPAKHRMLSVVSNRYMFHVAVVAIVAMVSTMNLGGSEVRAESFGQESMLYALVSQDNTAVVEVVAASTDEDVPASTSYMDDSAIDASAHVDFNYLESDYVTTMVGGSVSAPALYENAASIAARTAVETYVVTDGDMLGSIADDHGLSLSSLLWANNLTFRSIIRPGQALTIPPVDGVIYTVKKGDTLGKIAKTYSAETEKIIAFNKLADANDLVVGEQIILPDGEPPTPVVPRTAPVARIFSAPANTSGDSSGVKSRGSVTGKGTWVWPTDWRVITQYYGWKHTGVDVDGDYSTQSYAAADGQVIYTGWRNGYGLTVEIDHGNGIVTRYAHHSKIYVNVGDVVTAGTSLAQTGTTGRSTGTHLHFEVIKNGKFQNPLDYVR